VKSAGWCTDNHGSKELWTWITLPRQEWRMQEWHQILVLRCDPRSS
jgi:hypothetical protein